MPDVSDLRKGIKIKIDGQPHHITDFSFTKPGKGQAVYRCKIRNMINGNSFDKVYRSGDKFEKAELYSKTYLFSYVDGDEYVFVDPDTYDQLYLNEDALGKQRYFLIDDCECEILFFEDKAIEVALPNFVEKEIIRSEPGVRGDTATNVTKPAYLDNDYEIHVPIFVNEGDTVKIDTRTGEYSERVSKK